MSAAVAGFGLGLSFIVAIGAQNAFVLRQGLLRQHVLAVVLICAVSDAVLISVGVAGFGALATALPWLEPVMRYGGVAFLAVYGFRALRSAWTSSGVLKASGEAGSLKSALLTCLAFTWLNPHVYLDTVVLLGSISSQYPNKLAFALGGITASFVFFFSLGFGARLLAPFFARPLAWRILDALVGALMWAIAVKLLLGQ
jgi:L-lysine exporter family protein LysE/ArgO